MCRKSNIQTAYQKRTETVEALKKAIEEAQLVLVGIGNEFAQELSRMEEDDFYASLTEQALNLSETEEKTDITKEQMLQYIKYHYLKKNPDQRIVDAYNKLQELLEGKNYFIVSLCMDDLIYDSSLQKERIVTPCGGYRAMQCGKECVTDQEMLVEDAGVFEELLKSIDQCEGDIQNIDAPVCAECCKPLWFNQIGTPEYKEEGYLAQWQLYTKWLQGTLNKKLCIIELGASMQFPQIIRFPFEKIAFYNQKAQFFRVHSKLYQLTEELKDKGTAIKENPVDFLLKG